MLYQANKNPLSERPPDSSGQLAMPLTNSAEIMVLDTDSVRELFQPLLNASLDSTAKLEQWLYAWGDADAILKETEDRLDIRYSLNTADVAAQEAHDSFQTNIKPLAEQFVDELRSKFLNCGFRTELDAERFFVFTRDIESERRLYREANLPLKAQDGVLNKKYDTLTSALVVQTKLGESTVPDVVPQFLAADRTERESLWRGVWDARLAIAPELNHLYDELRQIRTQIATNANFPDYREYAFVERKRFDYTPEDCERFGGAVERLVVPIARRMYADHGRNMGLDTLRPWDISITRFFENVCEPAGVKPLMPYTSEADFLEKTKRVLGRIDPSFQVEFETMRRAGELDLMARAGKAPGGGCYTLNQVRRPFIRMNASGTHDDPHTLIHELGHGFHAIAAAGDNFSFYRAGYPLEFAEVASMSMELFSINFFDEFYGDEGAKHARASSLRNIVLFLPYAAQVDQFQHWIYTNPGHTAAERNAKWSELTERFGPPINWEGLEKYRDIYWQQQLHIFCLPFYYFEYAVAQLGALQMWANYEKDKDMAIAAYKRGLSLGGSRPLPDLFKAAEIKFDFSEATLRPLAEMVAKEYEKVC